MYTICSLSLKHLFNLFLRYPTYPRMSVFCTVGLKHLAYEYAERGARLALVARRESRLRSVAALAEEMGSPDAIIIPGDVTELQDCQSFVNATVKHFGRCKWLLTKFTSFILSIL